MTKYDDLDWKELPQDVMEAAKKLGYDEKMWDKDKGERADWPTVFFTGTGYLVDGFRVGRIF